MGAALQGVCLILGILAKLIRIPPEVLKGALWSIILKGTSAESVPRSWLARLACFAGLGGSMAEPVLEELGGSVRTRFGAGERIQGRRGKWLKSSSLSAVFWRCFSSMVPCVLDEPPTPHTEVVALRSAPAGPGAARAPPQYLVLFCLPPWSRNLEAGGAPLSPPPCTSIDL